MAKIDPNLYEQLRSLIQTMGCELYGCQLNQQGHDLIFRIYIDKQKGVTLDDCTKVSNQVSPLLDVLDPFPGRYTLEVSSPGIERPLFELEHFKKYIGNSVKIRLITPINQRRQYKGILQQVEGENIYLLIDGLEEKVSLPFSLIERANLHESRSLDLVKGTKNHVKK